MTRAPIDYRDVTEVLTENSAEYCIDTAVAALRRALVGIGARVLGSEMTNSEKLAVVREVTHADRLTRTPDAATISARRDYLEWLSDQTSWAWTSDARRLLSLAADAWQDLATVVERDCGAAAEESARRQQALARSKAVRNTHTKGAA